MREPIVIGVLWTLLALPQPLAAQTPADLLTVPGAEAAGEEDAAPAEEPLPGVHEVVPRFLDLAEEAEQALEEAQELTDLGDFGERLDAAAARQQELFDTAAEVAEEPYPSRQRLLQLRSRAELGRRDLSALAERVTGRLERLGELRQDWAERRRFWQRWRDTLEERGELADLGPEIDRALATIDRVAERTGAVFGEVLDLQRRLETLERRNRGLLHDLEEELAVGRERLLERGAPPLPSAAFLTALREDLTAEARAGVAAVTDAGAAELLRSFGWLIVLQLVVAVLLGLFARRVAASGRPGQQWTDVLSHPWAIGLFVSLSTLSVLYDPAPVWWTLALVTLLAACGALLASGMFKNPWKRRSVYAIAVFYPLFLALETVSLPDPWFRLFLTAAAALGLPAALWAVRGTTVYDGGTSEERSSRGFRLLLWGAAAVLGAALLAEVAGYDLLARWLVRSAVSTAFVVFVVTLLVRLGRGAIQEVVHREASQRLPFLKRVGHYLALRLTWLLQAVLLVWAFLAVLEIWELAPSPRRSLERVLAAGLPPAEPVVTVGQVLLGVFAVYVAFLVSRILHALLDVELFERRGFDVGVGDSIKTLLHYAVLTVGFLLGLALLGVSLQSFAIVAGALGVGIGFGLQNIVNNFVSGLILLFERPVRAGDTVIVAGEWGTVKKIGLRSTIVTTFDRSEIIVPNSDLVSEKVTNLTLSDKVARILIPLGVAYGSDLPAVFRVLSEAVTEQPKVLDDPEPMIHFVGFGESSLDFEIRVWVAEVSDRLPVRSDLLADIDRRFREAGITIPFPQRDLHLREGFEPQRI